MFFIRIAKIIGKFCLYSDNLNNEKRIQCGTPLKGTL